MLTEEELVELANLWVDLDPNVASTLYTLRVADGILKNPKELSLEEWFMGVCIAVSHQARHEVEYKIWINTGGTENETNT